MADVLHMTQAFFTQNLVYAYPDGTVALNGVDLGLEYGEKAALVGPNGAGKSTLFLCALGILHGWSGRMEVAGIDASSGRWDEIRRVAGLVFQEPDDMLFMPTVEDDVAFGPVNAGLPPEEVERRVHDALLRVGMLEKRTRPAHHLSAGEKRRAALASVLSSGAKILLLDEPTSGLDPRNRRSFIALIQDLPATLFIASHDLAMVLETTQRVFVMNGGRIVASGPTRAVLSDEALMQANGLEVPDMLRARRPN